MIAASAAGLAAILAAGAAGASFASNGQDGSSMTSLTGIALACYLANLLIPGQSRSPGGPPRTHQPDGDPPGPIQPAGVALDRNGRWRPCSATTRI